MQFHIGDTFLRRDGSFSYVVVRILEDFVILERLDLQSQTLSRIAWPADTIAAWLADGMWVRHDAVDTDIPTARCRYSNPTAKDYKTVPYSSMASEEQMRLAVRRQLTAGLREWPLCNVTGRPVPIHYALERAVPLKQVNSLRGAFVAKTAATDKSRAPRQDKQRRPWPRPRLQVGRDDRTELIPLGVMKVKVVPWVGHKIKRCRAQRFEKAHIGATVALHDALGMQRRQIRRQARTAANTASSTSPLKPCGAKPPRSLSTANVCRSPCKPALAA